MYCVGTEGSPATPHVPTVTLSTPVTGFLGVHDPENKNVRSNKFCKQFRINFDTIAADEPVTL